MQSHAEHVLVYILELFEVICMKVLFLAHMPAMREHAVLLEPLHDELMLYVSENFSGHAMTYLYNNNYQCVLPGCLLFFNFL